MPKNEKHDKSTQVDYVDYVVYVMPKYVVPDYLSYYLRQFQYKPIKHNYKRKPHITRSRYLIFFEKNIF